MARDQELIILGLLNNGAKHGYEIKSQLKQVTEIFAGLDTKSVYYPLKIMEKKGLVTKKVCRVGKRPERYTYSISPKGKARFKELLNKSLITINRPSFNIDLSLFFLPYIKLENVGHKLGIRLRMLKRINSGLENLKKSKKIKLYHHLAVINHNIELIKAEIRFITELISRKKELLLTSKTGNPIKSG